MPTAMPTLIGTSGWAYDSWRGVLYPEDLPRASWLARYAAEFPVVEVNATFYRLPTDRTVRRWLDAVPSEFVFVAKGSRFLTHTLKLAASETGLARFFAPLRQLGDRLDAVLWQLPPWLGADVPLLADFLDAAGRHAGGRVQHAVEFRHASWYRDDVLDVLAARDAMVVAVSGGRAAPAPDGFADPPAGGRAYIRFHGLDGGAAHKYRDHELRPWVDFLHEHPSALVFFNNDVGAAAVHDARRLRALLGAPAGVGAGTPSR